ncbi:hypothetical protein, partial [Pseudomonas syringae]|uniref:hypothetical protein n=1 Tax=Pseudomonas syringae TaxID=317 RepID=UPI001C8161D9
MKGSEVPPALVQYGETGIERIRLFLFSPKAVGAGRATFRWLAKMVHLQRACRPLREQVRSYALRA